MWTADFLMILGAIFFDLLIGDPARLPHFVNYVGTLAKKLEHWLWKPGKTGLWTGAGFFFLVAVFSLGPILLIEKLMDYIWSPFGWIIGLCCIFQSIAYRDLICHLKRIVEPFEADDLIKTRHQLSFVVGRDTKNLSPAEISRATIETLAESLNDGVIAPLFWALVLGPIGALLFRITNTLDSMVGHQNRHYQYFGKTAARIDDILGFIPARITAILIWIISSRRNLKSMLKEAAKHASWNAGYPESAMAYGLNLRLGGSNQYEGEIHYGPIFNPKGKTPELPDIRRAIKLSHIFYIAFISLLIIYKIATLS